MATDLHPGGGLPHLVGVVDDRGGEPEDAPLDRRQRVEVELLLRRGGGLCGDSVGHSVSKYIFGLSATNSA